MVDSVNDSQMVFVPIMLPYRSKPASFMETGQILILIDRPNFLQFVPNCKQIIKGFRTLVNIPQQC